MIMQVMKSQRQAEQGEHEPIWILEDELKEGKLESSLRAWTNAITTRVKRRVPVLLGVLSLLLQPLPSILTPPELPGLNPASPPALLGSSSLLDYAKLFPSPGLRPAVPATCEQLDPCHPSNLSSKSPPQRPCRLFALQPQQHILASLFVHLFTICLLPAESK